MTGSSPDKADCIAVTDPGTMVSAKPEDQSRGKLGKWWDGLTDEVIFE